MHALKFDAGSLTLQPPSSHSCNTSSNPAPHALTDHTQPLPVDVRHQPLGLPAAGRQRLGEAAAAAGGPVQLAAAPLLCAAPLLQGWRRGVRLGMAGAQQLEGRGVCAWGGACASKTHFRLHSLQFAGKLSVCPCAGSTSLGPTAWCSLTQVAAYTECNAMYACAACSSMVPIASHLGTAPPFLLPWGCTNEHLLAACRLEPRQ